MKIKNVCSFNYRTFAIVTMMIYLTSCSEITAPPDDLPPNTPQNFSLLGGGDGQASFRWSRNVEADFSVYVVYRAVNDPQALLNIAETEQNEFVDRFLDYDSVYYYQISAKDFAGNESVPTQIIDVRPINISSPTSPTSVNVFGHNYPDQNQIEFFINWTTPNIGDLWKYFIYRGSNLDFEPDTNSLLDSTSVSIYYDRKVNAGDVYYYRISAMDLGRKTSIPSTPQSDIILDVVLLESPTNRIEFRAPYTFSFKSVNNAVAYQVFVAKSPLSDIVWTSVKISDTNITYNGPSFEEGSLYYWWVGSYSKNSYLNASGTLVEPDMNSRSDIWSFFVR